MKYTVSATERTNEAKSSFTEEVQERIVGGLTEKDQQFATLRNNDMCLLYRENYLHDNLPVHQFETRTTVDHTHLIQGRVPFKKMTAKGGFLKVLVEELDARELEINENDRKKISIVKKKLQLDENDKHSFKPVLPYERFEWY